MSLLGIYVFVYRVTLSNIILFFSLLQVVGKKKKKEVRIMLSLADLSESFRPLIVHDCYRVGQKVRSGF